MSNDSDACVPKAVTDFVFDLFDSVTLSQLTEEQTALYHTDFRDLCQKYFATAPWPSPTSIAVECNGNPLFLALYRELTHRHWHAVSRISIRDRIEGWQVYKELFDELLEAEDSFYLLPSWVFDIVNEFVYQFQGFCQVRSAVYSAARKHGLFQDAAPQGQQQTNLANNLHLLQNSTDVWDTEAVFSYLHRLIRKSGEEPVFVSFRLFGSVALSRLECLLGDYTACLQALVPVSIMADTVIPKEDDQTAGSVLNSVFGARLSVAYHAGIAYMMLRRYKDAIQVLGDTCGYMQRGFKSGALRKQPSSDQYNKQYDRMLALLAMLVHVCPTTTLDDAVLRTIREKHGSKVESSGANLEEFFQSPKFISADPNRNIYRQQVQIFMKEMNGQVAGRTLRSYLKLYTALPFNKLKSFYHGSEDVLLAYKLRMRQVERGDDYANGTIKSAMDIHYYIEKDVIHVDEAEKQRRFENYFLTHTEQNVEIRRQVIKIDTLV